MGIRRRKLEDDSRLDLRPAHSFDDGRIYADGAVTLLASFKPCDNKNLFRVCSVSRHWRKH